MSVLIEKGLLRKLRKTILYQYPVSAEDFQINYHKLFNQSLKPEDFGCADMGLFAYKIKLEHKIWETSFKNNQVVIKPSRDTIMRDLKSRMNLKKEDDEDQEDQAKPKIVKLPEDALLEAQLPPLSKKKIVEGAVFPVVVSDLEGPEKFWFQIYGPNHYTALQSLMKDLDNFYKSVTGDSYMIQDITGLKLGTVLAAKFQDVYHRVVLKSIMPHNMKVKLEYIDYGTMDIQPVTNCRYLIPKFTKLPAQAIQARLSGVASVKGAKTEDGKDVRLKMWEIFSSCITGTIVAEVKSGVNIHEFVAVQKGWDREAWAEPSSKRGLAVELFDGLLDGGEASIGGMLVQFGLAEEEVREEKFTQGKDRYYVVRKEIVINPSTKLQFLRQHEDYLATRLEQFRQRAHTEKNQEDSARFEKIRQRIEDLQSQLKRIREMRDEVRQQKNKGC